MAHIQSYQGSFNTSGASASFTLSSSIGNGDAFVGQIYLENATNIITGVTDDKSNTYTLLDSHQDGSNNAWVQTFGLVNITNGPTTIKVNFSATPSGIAQYMFGDEYSSVGGIDAHNMTDTTTGTSWPTGSLTLSHTNDTLWTGVAPDATITAQPSGYTLRNNGASTGLWTADFVESSSGSYAGANWTGSTSGNAVVGIIALYPVFTASLSESASAADTVTVQSFTASWTLTENGSAADSPSGLMTASWTLAEAGTASDSESGMISAAIMASLSEIASAIDTLNFKLAALPPPPTPAGIYQPKDLQYAYQWLGLAQQTLRAAIANNDPSQVGALLTQIAQWQQLIINIRAVLARGIIQSEATRQGLAFAAPQFNPPRILPTILPPPPSTSSPSGGLAADHTTEDASALIEILGV